jgi:hypothetical protein
MKHEVAHNVTQTVAQAAPWSPPISHWPDQADLLVWAQQMSTGIAILVILLGVVYLLFGGKIYQWLVLLNAAVLGAAFGVLLGLSANMSLPLGVAGAFVALAVTWPLMKWAVAVMGGLFGVILGASVWRLCGLDPSFAWSGGLVGLVGFGLLSFILFHACVVMYTSLQGSVMIIFGVLSILYKFNDLSPTVTQNMLVRPFLLPMAIFIPAIIGIIYQQNVGGAAPEKG